MKYLVVQCEDDQIEGIKGLVIDRLMKSEQYDIKELDSKGIDIPNQPEDHFGNALFIHAYGGQISVLVVSETQENEV